MIILNKPRAHGKTFDAIRMSYRTGYPILCVNVAYRNMIIKRAKTLKFEIPCPLIPADLVNPSTVSKYQNGIIIDELPMILKRILGCDVHMATMTGEVKHEEPETRPEYSFLDETAKVWQSMSVEWRKDLAMLITDSDMRDNNI